MIHLNDFLSSSFSSLTTKHQSHFAVLILCAVSFTVCHLLLLYVASLSSFICMYVFKCSLILLYALVLKLLKFGGSKKLFISSDLLSIVFQWFKQLIDMFDISLSEYSFKKWTTGTGWDWLSPLPYNRPSLFINTTHIPLISFDICSSVWLCL